MGRSGSFSVSRSKEAAAAAWSRTCGSGKSASRPVKSTGGARSGFTPEACTRSCVCGSVGQHPISAPAAPQLWFIAAQQAFCSGVRSSVTHSAHAPPVMAITRLSTTSGRKAVRMPFQPLWASHADLSNWKGRLQVDRELTHSQLDGMCETIVRAQVNQILDMRHMMCKRFGVCDFQPTDPQ